MAEDVQTGGLHKFRYEKGYQPKLDDGRRKEIQQAYAQYDERRAIEKRNGVIFWIGLLIVLIALGFAAWKIL